MDDGGPEEDVGVVGLVEESNGVIEATERGIRALKLERQNRVVVKTMAEKGSVGLEKMVDGFRLVNKVGKPVY